MKKIKLLSLFLALLMLAGMATLFSSCGTEAGVITPSEDTVEVDFTDYTVLYGETQSGKNFTRLVRSQFEAFAARLADATDVNIKLQQASRKDADPEAKEILIGLTDREESAKALKKIDGDGFIIQVLENKIVIVGTSNLYTVMALDYFTKTYCAGGEASKKLTINETVEANEMESIELSSSAYTNDDAANVYTYVYKNGLGMIPSCYVSKGYDTTQISFKEQPMLAAEKIAETMAGISKLAVKFFPVGTDATTNEKEVLIGLTGRDESKAALAEIDETQYIIAVRGERVVINSYSNMGLNQAAEAYNDLLKEATVEDENGNTKVCLPRDFRLVGEVEHSWVTDFPKPQGDGITLLNTMDNNDSSLQYTYTGTGVNKTAYDAYCAQLKAAGYAEVQNLGSTAEGSVFKFFTNKAKDVALYVALNAYTHKGEFANYTSDMKEIDKQIFDPYGFETTMRIISSTVDNAFLPDATLVGSPTYGYNGVVTQTSITSMPLYSSDVGHCYIVALEDGSFIVYDGGNASKPARTQDIIWNLLNELHYQVWNKPASKEEPIHIAAWILSHAHGDHYGAFSELLKTYGKTGLVKMDYMIANIPSQEAYSSTDFSEVGTVMTPDTIKLLQSHINGGFKLIKPHTGMVFHLANVELKTMTTWEDLNPVMCSNTNDTNTVFRMTIGSQNSGETTSMMWLGDANRLQSRFMCATYGETLKVDMSTVAHHGNAGCEIEFYEMMDPETLFWTHNTSAAEGYLNPAKTGWVNKVDQYFTYQLASVKRIFTNGAQMFYTKGDGSVDEAIDTGAQPANRGFVQVRFEDGVVNFDTVKELKFTWKKDSSGKWTVSGTSIGDLAHTDISGGAAAWAANKNVMTFTSCYMCKCNVNCPTGEHVH